MSDIQWVLYVNNTPDSFYRSIEAAKSAAINRYGKDTNLRIESRFPLVANIIFEYRKKTDSWQQID